ncbi:MAG: GAF domain-containing protein [Anaerolineae bacterium]
MTGGSSAGEFPTPPQPFQQAKSPLDQVAIDLRSVLDSLFAFVGVLTLDGTLIAANRAPLEAAGIAFADVFGRKFWDCYWWNYDPQVQDQLRQACARAARGEMSRYDVPVRMAGGTLMMIDFMLSPMRDDHGQVTFLIPSAVDITQRTFAEEGREKLMRQVEAERARLETILSQMPAGVIIAEAPSGRLVQGNSQAEQIWRHPLLGSQDIGQYAAWQGFHRDGRPYAGHEWPLARAIATGEIVTNEEIDFMRGDGRRGVMLASAAPIRDPDGAITAGVVIFQDITDIKNAESERARLLALEQAARRMAERAADRMARLQDVASALSQALTPAQVGSVVVNQAMNALGAVGGVMLRLSDDGGALEIDQAVGYASDVIDRWRRMPLHVSFPLTDAAQTGRMVIVESPQDLAARYPRLANRLEIGSAWIAVPLLADHRVLGVMGMSFATARTFDDDDQRFLIALGQQSAQALERARLFEAERAARLAAEGAQRRLRVLAEASVLLETALEFEARLQQTARMVVPRMADWCGVDILREDGTLERVALTHVDPAMEEIAWEIWRRYPPDTKASIGALRVVTTGEPILVESISAETLAPSDDPMLRDVIARLAPRSYIIVPLTARGQVFGTLVMVYGPSGRTYTAEDLAVAETLGRRAGMAIENARLYQQAQTAIRVRDEFLSVASHELKTPLTSMLLHVQMLQRYAREERLASLPTGRVAKMLETNERQVKRLASLIADLLDASQIGSGRLELDREPTDLVELVASVIERYAGEAIERGSEISFNARASPIGDWDPHRLDQVVTNLLTNAIKYGAGRPIDIFLDVGDDTARLSVRDYGIGIAAEQIPRIFDRFERATSARTYGGIGLGLYITREIVDAHGGQIEVTSAPDEGSTFTVVLPLARPDTGERG